MRDPKAIVSDGYDLISRNYRADTFDFEGTDYQIFLREFEKYLGPGARVLDLGCGCGIPVSQRLSEKYRVTGLDISPVQIERARALAPQAQFVCADMTKASFAEAEFEGVVSFYAVIHVPVEEQYALFERIAGWLAEGGVFMATLGYSAWTGTEKEWHGGEMYWSHADRATYRRWLEMLGFMVLAEHFVPEGTGGHCLFIARKGTL